jgi:hypothetical protein
MRWPTRVLLLPRSVLRSLRSFIEARAGAGPKPPIDQQAIEDELLRTLPEEDLEFHFTPTESDASTRPTVPDNPVAKVVIPGSERPAPFQMPRGKKR